MFGITLMGALYAFLAICSFIAFLMWVLPVYNVWASKKSGEAALAEANKEQLIQRAEAEGRLAAAKINKEAAIIEAEAVSVQIEKIGKQLTQHDLYLRWQWIEMMRHRDSEADTIYVPTEAGLPILEAVRSQRKSR